MFTYRVNFGELHKGEVRLSPGPMGENFSGSCIVTSRNSLIHNGATTATKSVRFDPIRCTKVFCHGVAPAPDGPFATVNFGEFPFFYEYFIDGTSANRLSAKFILSCYQGLAFSPILPASFPLRCLSQPLSTQSSYCLPSGMVAPSRNRA
jgi:hypothetical protein